MLHTKRGHHPQSSEAVHARTSTTCVTHSSDIVEVGEGVGLTVVAELALDMLVMLRIVAVGPRVVTVRCVVGAEGEMGQVEELK